MIRTGFYLLHCIMSKSEDTLIAQYAPLVRRQALQMLARLPASVELDDLMQAGMMGLLDAIRRYQQMADAQFETYAITRIRGAMLDELRSQDWLPRSVRTKSRQIESAVTQLRRRLMTEPTDQEIADELALSLNDYHDLLEDASGVQIVSYEDLNFRSEDRDGDVLDFLQTDASNSDNPLDLLMSGELRQALIQALDALPEREKLLFALQFQEDLNQKEIAVVMDITEGRVSQLRSQAVARIRSFLKNTDMHQRPEHLQDHSLL